MRIELGGEMLADSERALRVLETSHPPTIYVPIQDLRLESLTASDARPTWCEFKGESTYWDAVAGSRQVRRVGWSYANPTPGYTTLRGHIAFFPGRVDGAWLGDEQVRAQQSDFYGGWITDDLVGPFKGPAGTLGW